MGAKTIFTVLFDSLRKRKMSTTTSCLIVFLLCLSLHACNARHVTSVNKMLEKKTNFYIKVCTNYYYYFVFICCHHTIYIYTRFFFFFNSFTYIFWFCAEWWEDFRSVKAKWSWKNSRSCSNWKKSWVPLGLRSTTCTPSSNPPLAR